MRLVKLIVTLVILGLIALFVWQNMGTWTGPISFRFELPLLGGSKWNFQLYFIMLLSALLGFVVGAGMLMKPWLKARRGLAIERKEKKEIAALPVKESQAQAS
ncbi:MAG: hypothetical protein WAW37_16280 [Syntrophobacteraceae bacterium]